MGGYLRIAAAAIIWGTLAIFVRLIDLPVLVMVFYRVFFAAVSTLIYMASRREIEKLAVGRNAYLLILMGALLALNWASFFFSIRSTSIANAVLVTYTAPVFIAVLAPLVLKERLERVSIITLIIAVAGIFLIASPSVAGLSMRDIAGIGWAAISAVTYAILVIIAKPLTERISVLAMVFFEELTCAIVLSPALFFFGASISASVLFILFIMGAVHTALAAALYLSGLRRVKAQQAAIFTYLDPASAIIFAAVILGEVPRLTTIFGGFLIVASGIILLILTRRHVDTEVVSE
ncbi:MAG: DMT family transporter [Actinomycetota bacterium]|nr:DMT family transporter [Actinomycetota bacterium]